MDNFYAVRDLDNGLIQAQKQTPWKKYAAFLFVAVAAIAGALAVQRYWQEAPATEASLKLITRKIWGCDSSTKCWTWCNGGKGTCYTSDASTCSSYDHGYPCSEDRSCREECLDNIDANFP